MRLKALCKIPALLFIFGSIFSLDAFAASDAFLSEMCNTVNIVTGNAGKAFAAFSIVSVGIGFFSGRVSWGLMVGVSVGVAAMFGAPSMVAAITGKPTFQCNQNITYRNCVDGHCSCATGYTGADCGSCAVGYTGSNCDICDGPAGYTSVGSLCLKSCDVVVAGINPRTVTSSSGPLTCNATNYQGSITYNCDNGTFSVTGGSCSCTSHFGGMNCTTCATGYKDPPSCNNCVTGYTMVSGACQLDCPITGKTGINDTTVIPGNGSKTCNATGYSGSVDYSCVAGLFSIVSGSCYFGGNSACFTTNEGGSLVMTAPAGTTWKSVNFASYGTPNSCTLGPCHASTSASSVATACVGQTTCTISATNGVFGDPCGGTFKRMHVILTY